MGGNDPFDPQAERYKAFKKQLIEYLYFFAGAGGLLMFLALSFISASLAPIQNIDSWWVFWGTSFITASLIWALIGFCLLIMHYIRDKRESNIVKKLEDYVYVLNGEKDSDSGLVKNCKSNCQRTEDILNEVEALVGQKNLANKRLLFLNRKPEKILREFICDRELINDDNTTEIRLFGTMRGVHGAGSYSLIDHVVDFSEERICLNEEIIPFKTFKMAVPFNPDLDRDDPKRLYPFCARSFALELLMKVSSIYKNKNKYPLDSLNVQICFNGTDAFPSWQLWGQNRFIIIPSVGYDDQNLAELIPFGIAAIKKNGEKPEFIQTMGRLLKYYDNTLFKANLINGEGNDRYEIEEWRLSRNLEISVKSIAVNIAGEEIENMIVDPWKKMSKENIDDHKSMLSDDEKQLLLENFKQIAKIGITN